MTTAVLLSGGMDSIALTFWKQPSLALTIDYGQRPAAAEIDAAAHVCGVLGIPHEVIRVNCSSLGSGDLAGRPPSPLAPVREWWPFRNQLLITLAAMHLLDRGVRKLFFGSVTTDSSHIDGTPQFFQSMSDTLAVQEGGVTVSAPAVEMTSVELVRAACIPAAVLAWAHSCHVANLACGECRGCLKHYETTAALGWVAY
jgi:7-cyano-7-deazaguanine synthase